MSFDFDEPVDRRNTSSLKYDFAVRRGKPADVLPLWVADMDFRTPPEVRETLRKAADFGIFGYSESLAPYFEAVRRWYARYFGWELSRNWLVKTPGVVFALCTAIRALTAEGDAVMLQQPVYYPFMESVESNGRRLVVSELQNRDGRYEIDFADFERKLTEERVKLFLLCSPHNPVGRVWTRAELETIGDLCARHGVFVVSDEIHADIVYPGHRHFVFASLKPAYAEISVTCTSPSKTFNLAGLQISNIFIPNRELRHRFKEEIAKTGYSQAGAMGLAACQAAYEHGRPWLEALLRYLEENIAFARDFLQSRIPRIRLVEPEGTYLLWLDCRALGLGAEELEDLVANRAGLWLDRGAVFGPCGEGYERINVACPRATLERALTRLERAVGGQATKS